MVVYCSGFYLAYRHFVHYGLVNAADINSKRSAEYLYEYGNYSLGISSIPFNEVFGDEWMSKRDANNYDISFNHVVSVTKYYTVNGTTTKRESEPGRNNTNQKRLDVSWATFTSDYTSYSGDSDVVSAFAKHAYEGDHDGQIHEAMINLRSKKYCGQGDDNNSDGYPIVQGKFYLNQWGGIDNECLA